MKEIMTLLGAVDVLESLVLPVTDEKNRRRCYRTMNYLRIVARRLESGTAAVAAWASLLYQRRMACGWTRDELAERAGVSAATIRNIEHRRHLPTAAVRARLIAVQELCLQPPAQEPPAKLLEQKAETPVQTLELTHQPTAGQDLQILLRVRLLDGGQR